MKNDSSNITQLLYGKNGSKKHLIFEKWENNENWQKWALCKGYSLCKMVSLGQKSKSPKTCDKRLFKDITVIVCEKGSRKQLIFEKWDDFENG